MSLSDRQPAPWSLDEFAIFDVYDPPEFDAAAPTAPETAAAVRAELEAEFAERLAREVAHAEAEAYARGLDEGAQAARETLEPTLAAAMQALDEAAQSVRLHQARWTANAEENVAALAVLVARHLVQREVAADPSFVAALVTQALEQYPLEQEITIRLHPDDLAACRGAIAHDDTARVLRWMADPSIVRGGCLTEGRERIIDGRVDTALERAYRQLAGVQAS